MKDTEFNITALEQMIEAIRGEKIEVTNICVKDAPYMHTMKNCLREGEFIISYKQLPAKKTYKTQREIYDEQFNKMRNLILNDPYGSIFNYRRRCNTYAVKKTYKAWKQQYE